MSGTIEELEKFNRFAEKHKINLICSMIEANKLDQDLEVASKLSQRTKGVLKQ